MTINEHFLNGKKTKMYTVTHCVQMYSMKTHIITSEMEIMPRLTICICLTWFASGRKLCSVMHCCNCIAACIMRPFLFYYYYYVCCDLVSALNFTLTWESCSLAYSKMFVVAKRRHNSLLMSPSRVSCMSTCSLY